MMQKRKKGGFLSGMFEVCQVLQIGKDYWKLVDRNGGRFIHGEDETKSNLTIPSNQKESCFFCSCDFCLMENWVGHM